MRNKGLKRSEAIQLIQDTFEFEGLGMQMRFKDAEAILDALIERGMLPPCRDANQRSDYGYARIYTWEDEDEKI